MINYTKASLVYSRHLYLSYVTLELHGLHWACWMGSYPQGCVVLRESRGWDGEKPHQDTGDYCLDWIHELELNDQNKLMVIPIFSRDFTQILVTYVPLNVRKGSFVRPTEGKCNLINKNVTEQRRLIYPDESLTSSILCNLPLQKPKYQTMALSSRSFSPWH